MELGTSFSKLMLTFTYEATEAYMHSCVMYQISWKRITFYKLFFATFFCFEKCVKLRRCAQEGVAEGTPSWFVRAAIIKHHTLGGLNNRICCLSVLEARDLQLRCWQGCFLLNFMGKNLFHVSLLSSGASLVIIGVLWLVEVQISVFMFTGWCLCVLCQFSLFDKDICHFGLLAHSFKS